MASETKHKEEEKGKEDAILRPDCKPNVVAFTMLLKSYLIECDVRAAGSSRVWRFYSSKVGSGDGEDDISQCACGVGIDSRALNTFFGFVCAPETYHLRFNGRVRRLRTFRHQNFFGKNVRAVVSSGFVKARD